ncbi:MAG: alpha/beta hydrolase [Bdellovibrionales bacterium]|nr:alpha/beta hydrolase [Bdellovibrionales bacterium]
MSFSLHGIETPSALYRVYSQIGDSDRSKPVCVYLPGIPGFHARVERALIAPQLPTDYPWVSLDLLGSGESLLKPGIKPTWTSLQSDLETIFDRLLSGRTMILIAHSFGAWVAMDWIRNHPGRVAKLILVNPVLDHDLLDRSLESQEAFEKMIQDSWHREEAQKTFSKWAKLFPADYRLAKSIWFETPHLASKAGKILGNLPTLILHGSEDRIAPWNSHGRKILEGASDVSVEFVSNAGHWPHFENPAAALPALIQFMEEKETLWDVPEETSP